MSDRSPDAATVARGPGVPDEIDEYDGTPDPRALDRLIGSTIAGKYTLNSLLGHGGMGVVFRAHHELLRKDVAVKILHPHLSRDAALSRRFDREAQSAARLEHPNVVSVSEYGSTDDGMKYMVMQLLEGEELDQTLGVPLSPKRSVELALQIFSGLAHAHAHGVVHRDLKPENIFVTSDHDGNEVLKIVDFGIAKIVSDDRKDEPSAPLTQLGLVFGTPQYMSPEQATGSPVDLRSDLYSAGIILYEMLAGAPPFVHEDAVSLVRMQVGADPPPLPPDTPEELRSLVMKLLSKNRDERYADARTVRDLLRLMAPGLGVSPLRVGVETGVTTAVHPSTAVTASKRPAWVVPLVAALVAGAGVAAVLMLTGDDAAGEAAAGEKQADTADAAAAVSRAPEGSLTEIDRAMLAKQSKKALELIRPLRDEYPDDPLLLWREGRAMALQKRRSTALERYAEAMDNDPELVHDKDFYAELLELLEHPTNRKKGLDVALQKMGEEGHKYLLGRINETNPKRAMKYGDRQRVLDQLRKNAEVAPLINEPLNVARDLWQSRSHQSPKPCIDYDAALRAMELKPDEMYLESIDKGKVPSKFETDEEEAVCATLEARRDEVRAKLLELYPRGDGEVADPDATEAPVREGSAPVRDEEAPAPAKKKKKKKKKKRG